MVKQYWKNTLKIIWFYQTLFWFEYFNIAFSCLNLCVISIVIYSINDSKQKDHYHKKLYIYIFEKDGRKIFEL